MSTSRRRSLSANREAMGQLDLQAEPILGPCRPVQGSTVDPDRAPCLTLHRGRGRV